MIDIENDSSTPSVASTFTDEMKPHDPEKGNAPQSTEEPECLAQKVAKEDEKSAARWKLVVLVLLSVNAVVIVLATYTFLGNQEEKKIENAFTPLANTVIDAARYQASNLEKSLQVAADNLAVLAETGGSSFPNVSIPHFDTWGDNILDQIEARLVGFAPLVNDTEQKQMWEAYAREHPWYNGTATAEVATKTFVLETFQDKVTRRPQRGPGPYAPAWQVHPAAGHESLIMYDLLSNPVFQRMFETMEESGQVLASPVLNLDLLLNDPRDHDDRPDKAETRKPSPQAVYFQPVYNRVGAAKNNAATVTAPSGLIFAVVSWEDTFQDVLAEGPESLYCIIEDDCANQQFTLLLEGSEVTFLGLGDHHNNATEDLTVATQFGDVGFDQDLVHGNSTTSSNHHCRYRFQLYPTANLQKSFQTSLPLVVSVMVAIMFFVTAAAFMIYVTYIQNRQERLLSIATHTSQIVSGLFPTSIRDKILKDAEDKAFQDLIEGQEAGNKKSQKMAARRGSLGLRGSLRSSSSGGDFSFLDEHLSKAAGNMLHSSTAPIAEDFADTTLFFGDIVGFTAWSATRSATEVFHLLETLYGAFDKLASRHGVYKIETVGDCYVSVTGVPKANARHAVDMASFALDCMAALPQILASLGETLGQETRSLNMRIGLHSGSVTGGVLRGERGRFQLFGDSMNTAARIETSGLPGRIHLSQTTADNLIALGRSSWVVPRDEKVIAKGKGELTTYWLAKPGLGGGESSNRRE